MKVVFIKTFPGQGTRGETREVKPGYARNFLLPQKFAVLKSDPVGKQIIGQVDLEKAKIAVEEDALKEKLAELQGTELVFSKKLTEKGKLFSAVKDSDIAKEFEKKTKLEVLKVELEEPIKEVGEQSVEVHLKHGLSLFVTVKVVTEK